MAEASAQPIVLLAADWDLLDLNERRALIPAVELGQGDRLAPIGDPYRLPYPDAMFDAVLSSEVFEHVQDDTEAFREIRRVLRSGGTSIHMFPSRYVWREPNVFTPLGTIIQSRPWLLLWAKLGVRNSFQQGMEAAEVANINHRFLAEQTNYLRRV